MESIKDITALLAILVYTVYLNNLLNLIGFTFNYVALSLLPIYGLYTFWHAIDDPRLLIKYF